MFGGGGGGCSQVTLFNYPPPLSIPFIISEKMTLKYYKTVLRFETKTYIVSYMENMVGIVYDRVRSWQVKKTDRSFPLAKGNMPADIFWDRWCDDIQLPETTICPTNIPQWKCLIIDFHRLVLGTQIQISRQ